MAQMDPSKKLGHNVLHLIYPIRHKKRNKKSLSENLQEKGWKNLFQDGILAQNYFPNTYGKVMCESDTRNILPVERIINYFHPSIQDALFYRQNRPFGAFYKVENKRFTAKFCKASSQEALPNIQFEWTASEIYTFSSDLAFLVVRVSLIENWQNEKELEQSVLPLEVWTKFANRIRQNYQKFDQQERLDIMEVGDKKDGIEPLFFKHVERFLHELDDNLILSNVVYNEEMRNETPTRLEPNAFIHAFTMSDFDSEFTNNELYQLIHIDDNDGESGGLPSFKQQFLNNNVYRRWENYNTFYTAIDYGTMTVVQEKNSRYVNSQNKQVVFGDLFYQHHCRMYLLFIVLQLYYREELQELMGRYARLDDVAHPDAENILNEFYTLNQYFFFKRVSQEIQGRELWEFYYRVFDIDNLLTAVQHDMNELNNRRVEYFAMKQQRMINKLTIITAFTGLLGMNVLIPLFSGLKFSDTHLGGWLSSLSKSFSHNTWVVAQEVSVLGTVIVMISILVFAINIVYRRWKNKIKNFSKKVREVLK